MFLLLKTKKDYKKKVKGKRKKAHPKKEIDRLLLCDKSGNEIQLFSRRHI